MKQADLYTVEVLEIVELPDLTFKVVKNTNNGTGKIDYRAIPCTPEGKRIDALPIHIAPTLEQITDYINEQKEG